MGPTNAMAMCALMSPIQGYIARFWPLCGRSEDWGFSSSLGARCSTKQGHRQKRAFSLTLPVGILQLMGSVACFPCLDEWDGLM